jgi:phosphoglycolate phosphatase
VIHRLLSKGYVTGLSLPDALIFDLDGTLWDAAEPTTRGWNAALERLGAQTRVTVEGIRSVAGTPFVGCVEILVPELCPPTEATLQTLDIDERAALIEVGGTLFPGVAAGLGDLADVYPLYLVSNCQDWYLDLFMDKSGLAECFAGADCNGLSGLGKADMLLRLADTHGLENAVYVGDTQGDHDSTREAGMSFAFARYGFGSVSEPAPAFDSFGALVDYYLRACAGTPASDSGGDGTR